MPSNAFNRTASPASAGPSCASCRVTRSSALMPTRSLKALWPLIAGVISLRRKSATALSSSVGVGSSCMLFSSRCEQAQQIDFRFRRAPADHRALHRMIRPLPEPLHHAAAHQAPAQCAHHFPEHHPIGVDLATGFRIAGEQILARTEAADRLVDFAEPPGVDADPAQVLHRIADMRELPVQYRADAVGADDE